jgi:cell division protein FtsB
MTTQQFKQRLKSRNEYITKEIEILEEKINGLRYEKKANQARLNEIEGDELIEKNCRNYFTKGC